MKLYSQHDESCSFNIIHLLNLKIEWLLTKLIRFKKTKKQTDQTDSIVTEHCQIAKNLRFESWHFLIHSLTITFE